MYDGRSFHAKLSLECWEEEHFVVFEIEESLVNVSTLLGLNFGDDDLVHEVVSQIMHLHFESVPWVFAVVSGFIHLQEGLLSGLGGFGPVVRRILVVVKIIPLL